MPIYEFRCSDCDAVFARLLTVSQSDRRFDCPSCGSSATERILSTFAAGSSSTTTEPCPAAPSCGAAGGG